MTVFTVWYVLSVVTVTNGHITNLLGIEKTKEECVQRAARVIAAEPSNSTKWACHEMTVKVDASGLTAVEFPNY
jgi:hypothetical protein